MSALHYCITSPRMLTASGFYRSTRDICDTPSPYFDGGIVDAAERFMLSCIRKCIGVEPYPPWVVPKGKGSGWRGGAAIGKPRSMKAGRRPQTG